MRSEFINKERFLQDISDSIFSIDKECHSSIEKIELDPESTIKDIHVNIISSFKEPDYKRGFGEVLREVKRRYNGHDVKFHLYNQDNYRNTL